MRRETNNKFDEKKEKKNTAEEKKTEASLKKTEGGGEEKMRLTKRFIEKDGGGSISLEPQEAEDFWTIYQLVMVGDRIQARTLRKVSKESSTGTVETSKIKLTLAIEVTGIEYNPGAECMRISGRNETENPHVKLGAHHTFDLILNRVFTLYKAFWDTIALEIVDHACDVTKSAEIAAVIMEEGLAHVCLITNSMTLVRQKIEVGIPGKRKGDASKHDKSLERFFQHVFESMQRHFNFQVLKAIVIASPGFTKDSFNTYMWEHAQKLNIKVFLDNRAKFILAHSSSGHKHALNEVLENKEVAAKLTDTRSSEEAKAMQEFYEHLMRDTSRACYGFKHVTYANSVFAIDKLLITDELFRSASLATRKIYVALVESVKANNGKVLIFSVNHVTGEELQRHTGIAAILRQPLAELDDLSGDEPENVLESPVTSASSSSGPVPSSSSSSQ